MTDTLQPISKGFFAFMTDTSQEKGCNCLSFRDWRLLEGIYFGVPETFHSANITDSVGRTFQLSKRDKGNRNKEICRSDVFLSSLPVLPFHLLCSVTGTCLKFLTSQFTTFIFFLNRNSEMSLKHKLVT